MSKVVSLCNSHTAEDICAMIRANDPTFSNWRASDWMALSSGANTLAGARRDPLWFEVSVLAATRSRPSPDVMHQEEVHGRVALLLNFPPDPTIDSRNPAVLFSYMRQHLENWTPEGLANFLSNRSERDLERSNRAGLAAHAQSIARSLSGTIPLPDDLSTWSR